MNEDEVEVIDPEHYTAALRVASELTTENSKLRLDNKDLSQALDSARADGDHWRKSYLAVGRKADLVDNAAYYGTWAGGGLAALLVGYLGYRRLRRG